jgi:hypothetical protein
VRTIREADAATRSLDSALERWSRAMDAWEAATWAIAHDPESGEPVTESGQTRAYSFEGARSIDLPSVTLVYEIEDDNHLIVHDALFMDSQHGQAGRG